MSKVTLVFDVGGTHLRAGCYAHSQAVLSRSARMTTPNFRRHPRTNPKRITQKLVEAMKVLAVELGMENPEDVVVAFAGPVDTQGNAWAAPTILGPRTTLIPLRTYLERLWPQARIRVVNDVLAAGYRYRRHLRDSFAIFTVSSGIGCKVFIEGIPIVGDHGRGGELGHLRVDYSPHAPKCDCGSEGHLGAVASGRAVPLHIQRLRFLHPEDFQISPLADLPSQLDPETYNTAFVQAFHGGDPLAVRAVQQMGSYLGRTFASLHLALGLERFVLIGGFATALGEPYRTLLVAYAANSAWDTGADWGHMVELGAADDDSGLIGAGLFAHSEAFPNT